MFECTGKELRICNVNYLKNAQTTDRVDSGTRQSNSGDFDISSVQHRGSRELYKNTTLRLFADKNSNLFVMCGGRIDD